MNGKFLVTKSTKRARRRYNGSRSIFASTRNAAYRRDRRRTRQALKQGQTEFEHGYRVSNWDF